MAADQLVERGAIIPVAPGERDLLLAFGSTTSGSAEPGG
jgi:hypothetical protein